jgi:hypothetical protein
MNSAKGRYIWCCRRVSERNDPASSPRPLLSRSLPISDAGTGLPINATCTQHRRLGVVVASTNRPPCGATDRTANAMPCSAQFDDRAEASAAARSR